MKAGDLYVEISVDEKGFANSLNSAQKTFENAGKKMASAGAALSKSITLPIMAIGAGLGALGKGAMDMEKSMAEVFTLMPGMTQDAMDGMTDEIKNFSKEFGMLPEEVIPALYQAISAGVPPDNVFEFLGTSAKTAIGGVTNLETAVDGLTTVVNAYGKDAISADKASDIMFTTVKLGKTTMEELSDAMFQVAPVASSLDVGFGDIAAAMAAITLQGTPTSVAATQIRQLLIELSKEGTKASSAFEVLSGKSFGDFIASGGTLNEALTLMAGGVKSVGDNGEITHTAMKDLFGSVEAGQAAIALTGAGAEAFASAVDQMGTSAGATQTAFETMEETVSHQMALLNSEMKVIGIEVGEQVLPVFLTLADMFREHMLPLIEGLAEKVKTALEWFDSLEPGVQKNILAAIGLVAALGPVLVIIGGVISVLGLILSPIGLVVVAIAGLIAVGVLLWKNWEKISDVAKSVWNGIVSTIERAINSVVGELNRLIEFANKIPGVNIGLIGEVDFSRYKSLTSTQRLTQERSGAQGATAGRVGSAVTLATGTNFVPSDMMAMLHKGEAVVPRQYNPALGGAEQTIIVTLDSREIGRAVAPRIVDTVRVATAIR